MPDTDAPVDLWHHYGRTRATRDRAIPENFHWNWAQDSGPGVEVLGDLAGRVIGDLGAGAGRHAAHLTTHHGPARVDAIDASPAQHERARGLYGHLTPRLRPVHADAVDHLHATPQAYDALYAVFGAPCFTNPTELLPAAAGALRPGGRLAFSTLAHYLDGTPAEADLIHADIPATTPDRTATTMCRWVLQEHVWNKLLDQAGFTQIRIDHLPAAGNAARDADTLLITCTAPDPS